jgi:hypothetical protein
MFARGDGPPEPEVVEFSSRARQILEAA